MCRQARDTREWMALEPPKAPARRLLAPIVEIWINNALPMMGQRLATTCKLDMLKELDELVESDRKVAGDVLRKKGHTPRDWRKAASIAE